MFFPIFFAFWGVMKISCFYYNLARLMLLFSPTIDKFDCCFCCSRCCCSCCCRPKWAIYFGIKLHWSILQKYFTLLGSTLLVLVSCRLLIYSSLHTVLHKVYRVTCDRVWHCHLVVGACQWTTKVFAVRTHTRARAKNKLPLTTFVFTGKWRISKWPFKNI